LNNNGIRPQVFDGRPCGNTAAKMSWSSQLAGPPANRIIPDAIQYSDECFRFDKGYIPNMKMDSRLVHQYESWCPMLQNVADQKYFSEWGDYSWSFCECNTTNYVKGIRDLFPESPDYVAQENIDMLNGILVQKTIFRSDLRDSLRIFGETPKGFEFYEGGNGEQASCMDEYGVLNDQGQVDFYYDPYAQCMPFTSKNFRNGFPDFNLFNKTLLKSPLIKDFQQPYAPYGLCPTSYDRTTGNVVVGFCFSRQNVTNTLGPTSFPTSSSAPTPSISPSQSPAVPTTTVPSESPSMHSIPDQLYQGIEFGVPVTINSEDARRRLSLGPQRISNVSFAFTCATRNSILSKANPIDLDYYNSKIDVNGDELVPAVELRSCSDPSTEHFYRCTLFFVLILDSKNEVNSNNTLTGPVTKFPVNTTGYYMMLFLNDPSSMLRKDLEIAGIMVDSSVENSRINASWTASPIPNRLSFKDDVTSPCPVVGGLPPSPLLTPRPTTVSPTSEPEAAKSDNTAIYIGVGIALLCITLFILLGFYIFTSRRKKSAVSEHSLDGKGSMMSSPFSNSASTIGPHDIGTPQVPEDPEEQFIDISQLMLGAVIGSGGHGRIFKATYCGSDVAVKELLASTQDSDSTSISASTSSAQNMTPNASAFEILKEVQTLRRLRHPHIIQLFGCAKAWSVDSNCFRYLIVMELAVCSFNDVLFHHPKASALTCSDFSLERKLLVAKQVAAACAFIHDNKIIHRDIKPENILLDLAGNAKICDLGISRMIETPKSGDLLNAGTPFFMAPELLSAESDIIPSYKVDVYSFGILLWQTVYCKQPYPRNWTIPKLFFEVESNETRPEIDPTIEVEPYLITMMRYCWAKNPNSRPSFREIAKELENANRDNYYSESQELFKETFEIGEAVGAWEPIERKYLPAHILQVHGTSFDIEFDHNQMVRCNILHTDLVRNDHKLLGHAADESFHQTITGLALMHARTAVHSHSTSSNLNLSAQGLTELRLAPDMEDLEEKKSNVEPETTDLKNSTFVFEKNVLEMQGFEFTEAGYAFGDSKSDEDAPLMKHKLIRFAELGKGASGQVFAAINLETFSIVAIKEIRFANRSSRHQAVRELRALTTTLRVDGRFACSDVVELYDAYLDIDSQSVCLMMEYMNGGSLEDMIIALELESNEEKSHKKSLISQLKLASRKLKARLSDEVSSYRSRNSSMDDDEEAPPPMTPSRCPSGLPPLPPKPHVLDQRRTTSPSTDLCTGLRSETTLASISSDILSGIKSIHQLHAVHLDIKPANVLLDCNGRAKLADFGLARQLEECGHHFASTFVGTMKFMSPERLRGENYSYPCDIWSFGLTILTAAYGHFPIDLIVGAKMSQMGSRRSSGNENVNSEDENEPTGSLYWLLLERWDSGDPFVVPQKAQYMDMSSPDGQITVSFSEELVDFLDRCLQLNPSERGTAEELLHHPWLLNHCVKTHSTSQESLEKTSVNRAMLDRISQAVVLQAQSTPEVQSTLGSFVNGCLYLDKSKTKALASQLRLPVDMIEQSFLRASVSK